MQAGGGWWGQAGDIGEAAGLEGVPGCSGNTDSFPAAAAMEPAPGPQEKYQLITRNLQVWGVGGPRQDQAAGPCCRWGGLGPGHGWGSAHSGFPGGLSRVSLVLHRRCWGRISSWPS